MQVIFMKVTVTQLRQNIYKLLDSVAETGLPLEMERKGIILKIIAEKPMNKLDNIKPIANLVNGSAESLDEIDWSEEWQNDLP